MENLYSRVNKYSQIVLPGVLAETGNLYANHTLAYLMVLPVLFMVTVTIKPMTFITLTFREIVNT